MSNTNKTTILVRETNVLAGVDKRLANVPNLTLAGKTWTPVGIKGLIASHMKAASEVAPQKAAFHVTVQTERTLRKQVLALLHDLRAWIEVQYGPDATEVLTDFGFVAPVPTPTVAMKAEANTKRAATRAARHTMGKRQRTRVKGTAATAQGSSAKGGNGTTP